MLKKIFKKEEGFTLAELLIVVAIIAVLVAVSIPIFTSQLEKSRESTDLANLRAAKAAAVTAYLGDEKVGDVQFGSAQTGNAVCYYNTQKGQLCGAADANKCGKGTLADGKCEETTFGDFTYKAVPTATYQDNYIKVSVSTNGVVTCEFVAATS